MIRVLVIKPNGVEVKEVKNDYRAFKEVIEITSPIDCITRTIGDVEYDIWCDDEGLFKDDLEVVAISKNSGEVIVGNVMVANSKDGEATSLTDEDIERIEDNLFVVTEKKTFEYNCSMGCLDVTINEGGVVLAYGD